MNRTNRGLNRLVLFLVGVLALAAGVAAVVVTAWPAAADLWIGGAETARTWLEETSAQTAITEEAVSWVTLGALAIVLILIVLLIVVLTRIGGGRSQTLLRSTGAQNALGRVTVRETFVSDALAHSLGQRDEILFSRVSAADVHGEPVLHVSVTPRQNTSPQRVVEDLDRLLDNLAALTGRDVPTYISLHSGLRARLAHDQRRLS